MPRTLGSVILTVAALFAAPCSTLAQPGRVQTPDQFFGFQIGADGELARYPKVLEYFQHLAKTTDRVQVRRARQDDDGESVRAGDDQRAGRTWRG